MPRISKWRSVRPVHSATYWRGASRSVSVAALGERQRAEQAFERSRERLAAAYARYETGLTLLEYARALALPASAVADEPDDARARILPQEAAAISQDVGAQRDLVASTAVRIRAA